MLRELVFFVCAITAFIPNNPLTPMLGWSSWNTFSTNINESCIQETAVAMSKNGMQEVGYRYVNIDDGFFVRRNAQGEFQYDTTKFPSGMKAIADFIHDLGLNAGFYSDAGDDTCGSMYNGQDARGVGFYQHEEADAQLFFRDWGYDFIKVDFCGGNHAGLSPRDQYTKIHEAILKATPANKTIRYNLCRWDFPGTWAADIAESWRISGDIGNRFTGGSSVVSIMRENLYLSPYASPGHFNDMDMMEIGRNTFTVDEEKSHFGLWCIMSSPILIGCDIRTIPQRTLDIILNQEVLEVHQDILGLQAKVVSLSDTSVVLSKPLLDAHGVVRAVALFNWGDRAANMHVDFLDIQLLGPVTVRDLYAHADLGVFREYFEASVPSHGILLLRLEGSATFDREEYDGQDAFLHDYTEVDQGETARVSQLASASSGIKIGFLGNSPTNWAEFRDVYSTNGGVYELTIEYYSDENGRDLDVTVNGGGSDQQQIHLASLKGTGWTTVQSVTLPNPIQLKAGVNVIRLENAGAFAPDINRLVLKKVE